MMKIDLEIKEKLLEKAQEAKEKSYSPYSNFKVGAALFSKSGKIYTGCNIESAAFSPTNCAERTAFFKAISEGEKDFLAIAIVGEGSSCVCSPCGVCRQVMVEFCDSCDFLIILSDKKIYTLKMLFPLEFGPKNLR